MKNLLLVAAVLFGAWKFYEYRQHTIPTQATIEWSEETRKETGGTFSAPGFTIQNHSSGFSCDGRQYCSQMHSRAEAEFFTRNCPDTRMDGDHDGIPCENDSRF